MADISKIQVPGSATQYNIKDAQARRDIEDVKADLGALITPPRLDTNTNLDSVMEPGVYTLYANSSYLNKPTPDAEHGILEVWKEKYGDTGRTFQRLTYTYKAGRTNSEIWVRSKSGISGSGWTPWVSVSDVTIEDVENLLQEKTGLIFKIEGSYISLITDPVSLTPVTDALWAHSIVACSEGDKFIINADGGQRPRAWGFLDSGNHVLSMADASTVVEDLELTAPANAVKLVINDRSGAVSYIVGDNISSNKIDIQQSPSDSGKALVIGRDGRVRPGTAVGGDGLTDDIKEAILNAFNNVAWKNANGRQCYNALYDAFYGVEYPKITAVLDLGERTVYTKDALETIKWYLTVTYYETEESEGTVISASNYSLVGTLSEGINRLAVTYGNLSTTITVPAKTPKYNYRLSLGELTKHDAYPSSVGSQPLPWLDASTNRRAVSCSEGYSRFGNGNGGYTDGAYMIPVPGDATNVSVSITPASMYVAIQMWEIYDSNKIHRFVSPEKGWAVGTNSGAWENPNGNLRMISCNIKANSSGSTITSEPTEFNIAFS